MITVTGILTDAGGNPLPDSIIELYSRRNAGESFIHVEAKDKTDSEGRYSFALKSGEYNVYAQINHRSDVESLGIAVIDSELVGEATLEEVMAFSEPFLPESVIEVRSLTQEVRDKHSDVDGWQQQVSSDKDTATTQAGISTTQAGIATTQASTATTKANEAAASAVSTAADVVATAADRIAANNSSLAASANKDATAADRVQTGLDTVATAADRVQTGLDATATSGDCTQTGVDATQTAADRVQTGLDKTATADSASTATTKATEASDSATAAEASAVRVETFEASQYAMSAADWNANSEANKQRYKGSGVIHMGKHDGNTSNFPTVNEGIWQQATIPNILNMGGTSAPGGTSESISPIVVVAGAIHTLKNVNSADVYGRNVLKLPPVPDGTKTVNDGVITQHASAAKAFEGLAYPSDALTIGGSAVNLGGGRYGLDATTGNSPQVSIASPAHDGTDFILVFTVEAGAGQVYVNVGSGTSTYGTFGTGTHVVTIKDADRTGAGISLNRANSTTNRVVSGIQLNTSTTSVITTRQDFGYLESWPEKVSDKDVVFPLGNVQFGATTFDGIGLGTLVQLGINQPYVAFGAWDTTTVSYGKRWSTCTAADKAKLLADPRNNLYFDPVTNELMQVRYRIRVIEGLDGKWNFDFTEDLSFMRNFTSSIHKLPASNQQLAPQGMADVATALINGSGNAGYNGRLVNKYHNGTMAQGAFQNFSSDVALSTTGFVTCIPLFLRQTMNQGAYHPVHNPSGTFLLARESDGVAGATYWHSDTVKQGLHSTADMFTWATQRADQLGRINGMSGRGTADIYPFSDAAYAGQIHDLRIGVNERPYVETLEESKRANISGVARGKGRIPTIARGTITSFTHSSPDFMSKGAISVTSPVSGVAETAGAYATDKGGLNYLFYCIRTGELFRVVQRNSSNHTVVKWSGSAWATQQSVMESYNGDDFLFFPMTAPWSTSVNDLGYVGPSLQVPVNDGYEQGVIADIFILTSEFDQLPWTDIIGTPANIAATFGASGGIVGQWIPILPDGNSATEYPYNRKAIGASTADTIVYTVDNGNTWATTTRGGWDSVKNSQTTNISANQVRVVTYETLSNPTESASRGEVLAEGDVYTSCFYKAEEGNRLMPSLTGDIATSDSVGVPYGSLKLVDFVLYKGKYVKSWGEPTHAPLKLTAPSNGSKGVKAHATLTAVGGLLYPMWYGQSLGWDSAADQPHDFTQVDGLTPANYVTGEHYRVTTASITYMVTCKIGLTAATFANFKKVGHDFYNDTGVMYFEGWMGGGWGDDSTIPIDDNEGTETDLNGNVQKTFCHIGKFPLGIA